MKKYFVLLMTIVMAFACMAGVAETTGEEDTARIAAEELVFALAEGEEQYYENLIFNGDVTISGDLARIIFVNCEFNGNIILTADQGTQVMLLASSVNGKCIAKNTVKETTIDWSFPKFMTDEPVEMICEDCVGSLIALGDFDVILDGESYSLSDLQLYYDYRNPEAGYVPYEGQPASFYCIAQWWENGEKNVLIISEYEND